MALGAASGGTAMALRGTVGQLGTKLASSKWAIDRAKEGKMGAMTLGNTLGRGSFDLRGVKIGGKGLADTGLMDVGKAQEGGFEKKMEDQEMKRRKRAADLDKNIDRSKAKQDVNAVETDLQNLLNIYSHDLETLDKKIKSTRENAQDLASKARLDPTGAAIDPITGAATNNKDAAISAADKLADLKRQKKDIKDTPGASGRSINQLEDEDIPDAKHHLESEKRATRKGYIQKIQNDKFTNFMFKPEYSVAADNEAIHKIRMEMKLDSGEKH